MRWMLVFVLVLVSCGHPPSRSTLGSTDERGEPAPGELGSVCNCHDDIGPECEEAPCREGLVCGYPCGIDGCNSVCMTPDEAQPSGAGL